MGVKKVKIIEADIAEMVARQFRSEHLVWRSHKIKIFVEIEEAAYKELRANPLLHQRMADVGTKALQHSVEVLVNSLKFRFTPTLKDALAESERLQDAKRLGERLAAVQQRFERVVEKEVTTLLREAPGAIAAVLEDLPDAEARARLKRYKLKVKIETTSAVTGLALSVGAAAMGVFTGYAWIGFGVNVLFKMIKLINTVSKYSKEATTHQKRIDKTVATLSRRYAQALAYKVKDKRASRRDSLWEALNSLLGLKLQPTIQRLLRDFDLYSEKVNQLNLLANDLAKELAVLIDARDKEHGNPPAQLRNEVRQLERELDKLLNKLIKLGADLVVTQKGLRDNLPKIKKLAKIKDPKYATFDEMFQLLKDLGMIAINVDKVVTDLPLAVSKSYSLCDRIYKAFRRKQDTARLAKYAS